MHLNRRIKIQLAIFAAVALTAIAFMTVGYVRLPDLLFGVGHYKVTVQLPAAGGLYKTGNVTYRGTEVGRVEDVRLTDTGVEAVLSLRSDVAIPSDLRVQVHSQSAVGEQFVALLPRNDTSRPLRNGDVIPMSETSEPPDISSLLDATNRGLQAIPRDNLKTAVDEAYTAVAGLGPEIARFVKGSTALAIDARQNLDPLTTLVDQSQPVLDSQGQTSDSIRAWASHLAAITEQLQTQDSAVSGVLDKGGPAAGEVRQLFDRLQPTLPILLANLVSVGQVAIVYQADIEELLALVPQSLANIQGTIVAQLGDKSPYAASFSNFKLNANLPPPCTTGYLPASQIRSPASVDAPPRPADHLYCRIPQDAPNDVRGVRNLPCETRPGKRAPTVKMCESDENSCRSTTATTGKATRTRPQRARPSRNRRRARRVPPLCHRLFRRRLIRIRRQPIRLR